MTRLLAGVRPVAWDTLGAIVLADVEALVKREQLAARKAKGGKHG